MLDMPIGILGGGLAGLSLASFLNCDYEVLEKNTECGGLCRSLQDEGHTFDFGGAHIIFSRDENTLNTLLNLLGDNKSRVYRDNKIYFKGRFVKYPFENGLSDLSEEDNKECLEAFLNNNFEGEAKNLKEWVYSTFGSGIAEKYLIPYNEKIWNCPADQLSTSWVDGRIPKPPAEDIISASKGISTEGYTHQLYYYYPKNGGIQALIRAIEAKVGNVATGFEATHIKKEENWIVSDGTGEKEYSQLVSTIPLFELAKSMALPKEIEEAIAGLKYNSLISVMLGVDGKQEHDYTAVYIPDSNFLPHKICFPKTMSKNNVPGGYSIMAEITFNEGDEISKMSDGEILEHVVDGLHSRKFLDKGKVTFTKVMRNKYAYVVNDLNYDMNTAIVRQYFNEIGLNLCGRFSEYKYLNIDHILQSAQKMAEVLNG